MRHTFIKYPLISFLLLTFFIGSSLPTSPVYAQVTPLPTVDLPVPLPEPGDLLRDLGSRGDSPWSSIGKGALTGALSLDNCKSPSTKSVLGGAARGALSAGINYLGSKLGDSATRGMLGNVIGIGASFIPGGSLVSGLLGGLFSGSGGGGPQVVVEDGIREKERCLDALARLAGQEALQEITSETVAWIQEGFEGGNTGFVQNLEQRLNQKADQAFYRFMAESGSLDRICNTLEPTVVTAIGQSYINEGVSSELSAPQRFLSPASVNTEDEQPCELEKVIGSEEDVEAFLEGDFSKGGWEGWFTLVKDTKSNPYFAYLEGLSNLDSQIQERQQNERELLQQSGGFKPVERCPGGGPVGPAGTCQNGETPIIETPGAVVQQIISSVITSDIRRAELVDELDEVVAEFGQTLIGKLTRSLSEDGGTLATARNVETYNRTQVSEQLEEFERTFRHPNGLTPIDWEGEPFSWRPVWMGELNYVKISWTGRPFEWEAEKAYFPQGQPTTCNSQTNGSIRYIPTEKLRLDAENAGVLNPRDKALPPGLWIKYKCDGKEGKYVWDEWSDVSDCQYGFLASEAADRAVCLFDAWRLPIVDTDGKTYRKEADGVYSSACLTKEDAGLHYFVVHGEDVWRTRECVERNAPEGSLVQWKDEQTLEDLLIQVRQIPTSFTVFRYGEIPTGDNSPAAQLIRELRQKIIRPLLVDYSSATTSPIYLECATGTASGENCKAQAEEENVGIGEVNYPGDSLPSLPTPTKNTTPSDPNDPS